MEIRERYESLKGLVTQRKAEFDALMDFIENETSYLTAPASTRFHLCREGGLLEHSVNVCENMLKIRAALAPEIFIRTPLAARALSSQRPIWSL